jgi:hypothetical protein
MIIIGRKINDKFCQNVFLSNFLQRLKFSTRVEHNCESCPRLSTQVVFTAAFLKILLTYLSCLVVLSLVRVCAICCGEESALESSLKERALDQGATTTVSLYSAPSCIVV